MPGRDNSPATQEEARLAAEEQARQDALALQKKTKTAAALKSAQTNTSGVFTLDELHALGQTGDLKTDWMNGVPGNTGSLLAGGGRGVVPTDIPAGNYNIPALGGAYYYDPKSGQAPQEFIDWANSLKSTDRDPFTNAPKAMIANQDAGDTFRATAGQSPALIKTFDDIIKMGKGADGTYQDSQDRVLGIGDYQQFVIGKDGKQIRIQDVPGYTPPPPAFTDLGSKQAGSFNDLMKLTGQDQATLDKTLGLVNGKDNAAYWQRMEDALAANYKTNALKWKGLQDERVARGLDPMTGTSDAEKKRIYDEYNRIQDPEQRKAYIWAQDPGNLTAELRKENYAAHDAEFAALNKYEQEHPNVVYDSASRYGGPGDKYNQVAVTLGHQTVTDETTGRRSVYMNVPTKIELTKQNKGTFTEVADRLGGAIGGGALGFMTGGIPGAFLGTYLGAGGPMPNAKNISMKNSKGWGQWRATEAHGPTIREVGTAFAFAALTGSGMFGGGSVGSAPVLSPARRAALMAAKVA